MRKPVKIMLSVILVTLLLTIALLFFFNNTADNGFNRSYKRAMLGNKQTIDLMSNSWYIAGKDSKSLYLGNFMNPDRMMILNLASLETKILSLIFQTKRSMTVPEMFVRVDSPFLYLMCGKSRFILRGKIDQPVLREFIEHTPVFYSHFGFPVSPSCFIVKTYDIARRQYILSRIMNYKSYVDNPIRSLEKQVDGVFCTEGLLNYSKKEGLLTFTYLYRNEYLNFDTSLNLIRNGRTIDTNRVAKIKVDAIQSDQQLVLSKPPLRINVVNSVCSQYLFNLSKLKAANEDNSDYRNSSNVDLYDMNRREYLYSFHVPDLQDHKVSYMMADKSSLIVIQGQYLTKYHFTVALN